MRDWQILFTEPNAAALVEQDIPDSPGEHEVLVRTHYTAVSAGTERANLVGELHISGGQILERAIFPRALGYSGVGTVLKTGAAVTGTVPGDRVIIYFGQHRQYNLLAETLVFKIGQDSIASAEAALVVIAGFPLEGIRKARVEVGEAALVAGLGILGLLAV
ncbi:MAG: alcohol dehydrogenase catalytic domain-containing protein, partial [Anaerolineae bacterium]